MQSLKNVQFVTLWEISGYSIQARDGEIGSVDDFILEDKTS